MNLVSTIARLEWSRVLIIGAVCALLYFFILMDHGETIDAQIQAASNDKAKATDLLKKAKEASENASKFEEEVNRLAAQFSELVTYLPDKMNIAELNDLISKEAIASGVKTKKFEPRNRSDRLEFYEALRIDIKLQGTFTQVVSFLSRLTKVPRLITVENVAMQTFQSDLESAVLDFSATLIGYRYIPEAAAKDANAGNAQEKR